MDADNWGQRLALRRECLSSHERLPAKIASAASG